MIDFFGWKAKAKVEALDRACNILQDELDARNATIRELADIIRENDQLIYNMAQKTDWPSQRPFFNKLQSGQESRMKAESNRINDIMQKELIKVYSGKLVTNTKQLESK